MFNILSHFDLEALDPMGAERAHLEAEATKLAYDARNRFLADADHMTRLEHLRSPDTAARLAALIDPKRVLPDPAAGRGAWCTRTRSTSPWSTATAWPCR
jgi:gamma-glutamyltranspeptidase/glutathione hydrolase